MAYRLTDISDLPIYRLFFQISDIGIGWHSTDINIGYRISDIGKHQISDIGIGK